MKHTLTLKSLDYLHFSDWDNENEILVERGDKGTRMTIGYLNIEQITSHRDHCDYLLNKKNKQ